MYRVKIFAVCAWSAALDWLKVSLATSSLVTSSLVTTKQTSQSPQHHYLHFYRGYHDLSHGVYICNASVWNDHYYLYGDIRFVVFFFSRIGTA